MIAGIPHLINCDAIHTTLGKPDAAEYFTTESEKDASMVADLAANQKKAGKFPAL